MSSILPILNPRCSDCHHPEMPICGCQVDPNLKDHNTIPPGRKESPLLSASKWHSSRIGWPGPIRQPTATTVRPTFRARVGVDMTALQSPDSRTRGIGRYSLGLLTALARQDPDVEFLLYSQRTGNRQYGLPGLLNITDNPITIPVADAVTGNPDHLDSFLVLSPAQSRIRSRTVPRIISVIYDLIPEVLLNDSTSQWTGYVDAIRDYDHFFSISEHTRHDFITRQAFDPDKITTVLPGLDLNFWNLDKDPFHFGRINRPFILCVGSDEDRKGNLDAIAAVGMLPDEIRNNLQLVFAHATSVYHARRFEKAATEAKVDLVVLGESDDFRLRTLYRSCEVFLFPSHYEGFGLPVIEAMACGSPVIVANNSSLPEVVGDAALLVPTSDPASLSATLKMLLDSIDLQKALRQIGRLRAETFTWESSVPAAAKILAPSTPRIKFTSNRPRVALVGPWPPYLSGVSDYSVRLAEALLPSVDVVAVYGDQPVPKLPPSLSGIPVFNAEGFRRVADSFSGVIYQAGNNPIHQFVHELIADIPGAVVLHDLNISHLFEWSSQARTVQIRGSNPSDALQWLCDHATAIIVHSEVNRSQAAGRYANVHVIPYGATPNQLDPSRIVDIRQSHGIDPNTFLIGVGGIIHPSKLTLEASSAFALANLPANSTLIYIGAEGDSGMTRTHAGFLTRPDRRIQFTDLLSGDEFADLSAACDVGITLRLPPTNGETSSAMIDFLRAGVPTIVSDVGTFSAYPDSVVCKLSPDDTPGSPYAHGTPGLVGILSRMASDPSYRRSFGLAASSWVADHHSWPCVAGQYLHAIGLKPRVPLGQSSPCGTCR